MRHYWAIQEVRLLFLPFPSLLSISKPSHLLIRTSMTVNVGPVFPSIAEVPANPQFDGLGYNPRCLRRDVNPYAATVTTTNYTYHLITDPQNADIYWFQTVMQGQFDLGKWGVHTGGHFTIGGDPGGVYIPFLSPPFPSHPNMLTEAGFLHLSRRSSILPSSWGHRSHVVDLAASRFREEANRCKWDDHAWECAAFSQRHFI